MEKLSSYQIKDEQIVLCSLENCEERFKYKFALAKHLIKDHKVTPDDIKTDKHSLKIVENSSISQFPMSFLNKYLSSEGALSTQLKKKLAQQFISFCKKGNLPKVIECVEEGVDVNFKTVKGDFAHHQNHTP